MHESIMIYSIKHTSGTSNHFTILKKITTTESKCTINFLMYLLNPSEGKHLIKYFAYWEEYTDKCTYFKINDPNNLMHLNQMHELCLFWLITHNSPTTITRNFNNKILQHQLVGEIYLAQNFLNI